MGSEKAGKAVVLESPCFFDNNQELEVYLAQRKLETVGMLLAYHMALSKQQFRAGDGIIKKGVENTIATVARLARVGMEQTDKEIIHLMMES